MVHEECSSDMVKYSNKKYRTNPNQDLLEGVISSLRWRDQEDSMRINVAIETLPPNLHEQYRNRYERHLRRHARQIIARWEHPRGVNDSDSEPSEFEFSPQEETRRGPYWYIQDFVPCLSFLFIN